MALSTNLHPLQQNFSTMETNKLLAPFTTMQIGGPADFYYQLENIDELPELIAEAQKNNVPFIVLGGGSNIVFSDQGFCGLIIHLKAKNIMVEDTLLIAEAGALLSRVVQTSFHNNLTGMERFMGLPGTIGGAIRGNAGAFGVEVKDLLEKAEIYSPEKGIQTVSVDYFHFGYRESVIKHNKDIVLKAFFRLKPKSSAEALNETLQILKSRAGTQPSGRCSGSFFKNPDPFTREKKAGFLLDQAGCKGLQVGGAKVSDLHANWIMNTGNATFQDVLELSKLMQQKVKKQFGIDLEREVQLINEDGFLSG